MQELVERIRTDGKVKPGGILKVDSFLNHKIDPQLMYDMANEVKRIYEGTEINKVLTVEASGIGFAVMVGFVLGCPVVFAKKSKSANISDSVYSALVHSYTHGNDNNVIVSKEYLTADDKVLIVDDFLAMGEALTGLLSVVKQAGAQTAGAAIAIEKAFQPGGEKLRQSGVRIESLARIASMTDDNITFCD